MCAENCNFLKLLKSMIVGALWFRMGLLSIRILCFLNRITNDGVMAPEIAQNHDCGGSMVSYGSLEH